MTYASHKFGGRKYQLRDELCITSENEIPQHGGPSLPWRDAILPYYGLPADSGPIFAIVLNHVMGATSLSLYSCLAAAPRSSCGASHSSDSG
jgi:hypothetical protein